MTKAAQFRLPRWTAIAGAKPARVTRAGQSDDAHSRLVCMQSSLGNQGMLKLISGSVLQRKPTMNRVGDIYEQEADRVAYAVMSMTNPPSMQQPFSHTDMAGQLHRCSCSQSTSAGQCEECKAESMQKKGNSGAAPVTASAGATAPLTIHEVLSSPGLPLDGATRSFMEPRFGEDFGGVRIHTDQRAAESAQAVDALAYTVGRDIVFGAGQYAPHTQAGSRLLAHELSHVMQQSPIGGLVPGRIQRKEKDPAQRQDLAIVLSKDLVADANALAPGAPQVFANSTVELSLALRKISSPIGTLFIVGHGSPTGGLQFGNPDPFMGGLQKPEDIARAVRGKIPAEYSPERVDFRACNIGKSPKALEQYREAFNAKEAVGASCFLTVYERRLTIGGKDIRKRSDVTPQNRKAFEQGLKDLPGAFPKDYKPCIVDTSEDAFFNAGGKMIAAAYIDHGKTFCLPKMKTETVDPKTAEAITGCQLIRVAERQEPGKLPKEE